MVNKISLLPPGLCPGSPFARGSALDYPQMREYSAFVSALPKRER